MEDAINEYWDARTRLIKSFRKINYRIDKKGYEEIKKKHSKKYASIKMEIIYDLRKMDKVFKNILINSYRFSFAICKNRGYRLLIKLFD